MSILLNALKKSEAQRQVGGPPDIHAPVDASPGKHRSGRRWLPLVLLTVIAAILAWYGWKQHRSPESGAEAAPVEVAGAEPAADSATSQERRESAREASSGPAVEMLGEPSSAPLTVTNFPAKKDQETEQRKQQLSRSFTQFEAEPQVEAVDDSPVQQEAETDELVELESRVSAMVQEDEPDSGVSMESQRRASRSGSPDSEPAEATESEPISFWQIPQNLRENMPEFKITVLVYAEQPEDRFLLINGVRLVEKEELASGITLEEIRRDGAVFLYRNYRFLVKG